MPQAALDNHDYSITVTDLNIELGSSYQDYASFDNVIRQRKQYLGERWIKSKNLRTVEKANKLIANPQKHFQDSFCYSFITVTCHRGGICKSRASVRKTSTRKMNCPARITLKANRAKNKLIVSECHLAHNHEVGMPEEIRYPLKPEWSDCNGVNLQEVADICENITIKEEPSLPADTSPRTVIIDVYNPDEAITVVDEHLKGDQQHQHHQLRVQAHPPGTLGIKREDPLPVPVPCPNPRVQPLPIKRVRRKASDADKDVSTRDLLVALLKSREEDLGNNRSKHHNYVLTVAEKLDLLDMDTSLKARKEIDDLLLRYVLKEKK